MGGSEIFIKILLTVLFGAILGLETETREIEKSGESAAERREKKRIGGFRTYTLISLLGGISGLLFTEGHEIFSLAIFLSLVFFVLVAYQMNVKLEKAFGITTELAVIITFVLGFLTTSSILNLEVILVILVLLAFFLSQKRGFGVLIKRIQHKEVTDVFRFGLVSLVILPLLPNREYFLSDVVSLLNIQGVSISNNLSLGNPFQIWLIVVIISGINLGGYIASKITGTKIGLFFTSVIAGFISSTSAIVSFASKAKKGNSNLEKFVGSSMIANGSSFIFVGVLILVTSRAIFNEVLPSLLVMCVFSIFYGIFFLFKNSSENHHDFTIPYEPFSLGPAIKFVSIIIFLRFFVQLLDSTNADIGYILAVTALSGVTGIDAPAIAISSLFVSGTISANDAAIAFLMTNMMNLVAKSMYSYTLSTRRFFKSISIGLILTGIIGFIALLL